MSKALLHELGRSLSYGRLSLRAKVLWPMLLSTSDDQGRGLAEPDAIKWYVCPNVPEVAVEDVPALLQELVDQDMIVVYECDRGCAVYQIVRWWEYQELQWARPSKYNPPAGWLDRVRYSNRGDYHIENWDQSGGFETLPEKTNGQEQGRKPPRKPPRKPGDSVGVEPGRLPIKPNLTQPNSTQLKGTNNGAPAPQSPPAPSAARGLCLELYGPGAFSEKELLELIEAEASVGREKVLPALKWCHGKNILKMDTICGTAQRWVPRTNGQQHARGPPQGQTHVDELLAIAQEEEARNGNQGRNSQDTSDPVGEFSSF